jgi:hypothetical protein
MHDLSGEMGSKPEVRDHNRKGPLRGEERKTDLQISEASRWLHRVLHTAQIAILEARDGEPQNTLRT